MQKDQNRYIPGDEKIGAERVRGFVVKDKPSVEIAHDILSKFKSFPHMVVSLRNS
jgi:hypothetical protein